MVRRPSILSAVLVAFALAVPGAAAGAPVGALGDLPGPGGCVTQTGAAAAGPGTCLADAQLGVVNNLDSVAVAPDGRFVYAADEAGLLLRYGRDPQTGLLSVPAGTRCWRPDGSNGCTDYHGSVSGDGDAIAISADGRFLYATDDTTPGHPGVLVFARDVASGVLTQLPGASGCLTSDGAGETGACTDIRGPKAPNTVRLSPDQRFVYVTDFGNPGAVLSFARDPEAGTLTQLPGTDGCITGDGSSEDGAGTCQDGRLVRNGRTVTLTPDGRHALVADFTNSGVEVFDRDAETGVLTVRSDQASCITQTGVLGGVVDACRNGRALTQPYQVAVSADSRTVYVSSERPDLGIAVLRLDPDTAALTQPSGTDGCLTPAGGDGDSGTTCGVSDALGNSYGVVTGPDRRTLYAFNRGRGVEAHAIDPATGLLTPLPGTARCVNTTGAGAGGPGKCTQLKALGTAYSMAFAPDAVTAYVIDNAEPVVSALRVEARPVCSPLSVTTPFQTPVALTLPCSDPNGDPVTRQVASTAAGLSLGPVGAGGEVTATPATSFSGGSGFTYTATDSGGNTSDPATATVAVGTAPAAPAGPSGTADRTKPKVKLGKLRITKKGVRLTLTLSERATVRARLKGHFATGDKPTELARGSATAKPGRTTISLKLTKAGARLKQLKGKRLKAFRATLTVTATDAAGNSATAKTTKAKLTR